MQRVIINQKKKTWKEEIIIIKNSKYMYIYQTLIIIGGSLYESHIVSKN